MSAEEGAPGAGTLLNPQADAQLQTRLVATKRLEGIELVSENTSAAISALMAGGTELSRSIVTAFLTYAVETGPHSNLSKGEGPRKCAGLYRELRNYLNNAPEDFRRGFGAVLRIMNDLSKGDAAFSPKMLFRFMPDMVELPPAQHRGAQMLLRALMSLANPDGRAAALKQTNLGALGDASLKPEGKNNLITFFGT